MNDTTDRANGDADDAADMDIRPSLSSSSLPQPGHEILHGDNITVCPQEAMTQSHVANPPPKYKAVDQKAQPSDTAQYHSEDPEASHPFPHAKRSISEAVGRLNISVLLGGAILSSAAISFLIFLWTDRSPGAGGQNASYTWRYIILGSWLPQVITISTLALRVSIGAQTAICTSFVAALTLERRPTPLAKVAAISAFRSLNTSPRALLWEMVGKQSVSHPLHPEAFLFILLAIANVAIQFSSTILFADLQSTSVVGFPYRTDVKINLNEEDNVFVTRWSWPPRDYSLFGELPTNYSADPNPYGLSDTGVKRHAMLPLTKDRTTLRSYRGSSIVMSSRVACMPPVVSGEIRGLLDPLNNRRSGTMTGKIVYEESLKRANLGASDGCGSSNCSATVPFSCSIPNTIRGEQPVVSSFCIPQTFYSQYISSWELNDDPWTPDALMVLVFSTNIDGDGWTFIENQTNALPEPLPLGEWQSFDFGSNRELNMTLCFNAMNVMLSNVSLATKTNLVEPKIRYGLNVSDTENVRRFLGADPRVQDLEDRGVLVMDTITDPTDQVFGSLNGGELPDSQTSSAGLGFYLTPTGANQTFPGCDMCEGDFEGAARDYARIFLDILTSTNRAAVAVQTVYTMLAQSIHDQMLDFFTVSTPVEVVQTDTSTIPTSFKGLITVAVLVLVNDLCILFLTGLYIYHSRYTMIGDFWHAASQMVGNTTEKILDKGNLSKDSRIFESSEGNEWVQLEKSVESGRIGIVEVKHAINKPSVLQWVSKVYQSTQGIVKRQTSGLSKMTQSKTQNSASEMENYH